MKLRGAVLFAVQLLMILSCVHSEEIPDRYFNFEAEGQTLKLRSSDNLPNIYVGRRIVSVRCLHQHESRGLNLRYNVRWLRPNGTEIIIDTFERVSTRNDSHDEVEDDGDTVSSRWSGTRLLIHDLEMEYGGTYTCVSDKFDGSTLVSSVNVSVEIAPYYHVGIRECNDNQRMVARRDQRIKCDIICDVPPMVRWLKNGSPYVPDPDRCRTDSSAAIVCHPFVESDSGNYTILVSSGNPGSAHNRTIEVTVSTQPNIRGFKEMERRVVEFSTLRLNCSATGFDHIDYEWTDKDGGEFSNSNRRFWVNDPSGMLVIEEVNRYDAGLFTCKATNFAGHDIWRIRLIVTDSNGIAVKP